MNRNNSPILFSIVTVALNDINGLMKTYESVVQQTFMNWEMVIVDGGSIDGSLKFLGAIVDTRIRFISEKDNGIFDAMNKGARLSRGIYVNYMNAGDIFFDKDVLLKINNIISDKMNPELIAGNVRCYFDTTLICTANPRRWVSHQGVFILASLLKKYEFRTSLRIYGDLDLWMRLDHNGDYAPHRVEIDIACFDLGGLGNNPKNGVLRRFRDKLVLARLHNDQRIVYIASIRLIYDLICKSICMIIGTKNTYRMSTAFESIIFHK